ncbi:MAG: glutathione S-transferase [Polaromonas sp.]|nr:glutathione S-transferase [Polaromonas sp.]
MTLTLAYCPVACSMVPYILLTEAGADFDTLNINMGKGEHARPDFLRINPKGKVPALLIDGVPLTENVAIQLWIAQRFPDAKLMPMNPMEFARVVSVMAWCASGIHPKLTQQARPERYCDLPGSAESVVALGSQALMELFAIADQMLAGREWFSDRFSCADAYFFWCFRRGSMFKADTSGFRNCVAHMERMLQRPSVQKLVAYETKVSEDFAKAA